MTYYKWIESVLMTENISECPCKQAKPKSSDLLGGSTQKTATGDEKFWEMQKLELDCGECAENDNRLPGEPCSTDVLLEVIDRFVEEVSPPITGATGATDDTSAT